MSETSSKEPLLIVSSMIASSRERPRIVIFDQERTKASGVTTARPIGFLRIRKKPARDPQTVTRRGRIGSLRTQILIGQNRRWGHPWKRIVDLIHGQEWDVSSCECLKQSDDNSPFYRAALLTSSSNSRFKTQERDLRGCIPKFTSGEKNSYEEGLG